MSREGTIRSLLSGGDRRSIGRSDQVSALVIGKPERFGRLVKCLWDADPVVSMRAADAAEKVSRENPALLQPHKAELLGLLAEVIQKEVRWHLAVMVPRLQLTTSEYRFAAELLKSYMEDRSSIVKTYAMQGLFDLAAQTPEIRMSVLELLRVQTRTGTAAMRARGRKLIRQLESHTPEA